MHSDYDEDYVNSSGELELAPNVFNIWDSLQKPVTFQYTTEQLHSEHATLCTPQSTPMLETYAEMVHEGDRPSTRVSTWSVLYPYTFLMLISYLCGPASI